MKVQLTFVMYVYMQHIINNARWKKNTNKTQVNGASQDLRKSLMSKRKQMRIERESCLCSRQPNMFRAFFNCVKGNLPWISKA